MTDDSAVPPAKSTAVGIGLIERDGCYLIRQRPPGTVYAGYWEFPGGKCEPGEIPAETTARECREETGLDVVVATLRRVATHHYPHGLVTLFFYDCTAADATAEPDQSSGFCWVDARELTRLRFPEANEAVLEELARERVRRTE